MNFFKKEEKTVSPDLSRQKSDAKTTPDDLQEVLKRLSSHAGNTIQMLKTVLKTDTDILLLYSAGLAGYACQRAVMANNEQYVVVGAKSGRNYYLGDKVNAYLLENKSSVLSFINGIYEHKTGKKAPDPGPSITHAVSVIGDDNYKIWNSYSPDEVYKLIKVCWDGIFENMTSEYCKSPCEWPIFFGIVLQNIMEDMMVTGKEDAVYQMVLECTLFISKMRDDSLAKSQPI